MTFPCTGSQMFCARPKIYVHFVPVPNILCWFKLFGIDQKLIYILCQSQTFCATPKDDFHSVNLDFVLAQKFLQRHSMQLNFWTDSKNLDPHKTFQDLQKDKTYKILKYLNCTISLIFSRVVYVLRRGFESTKKRSTNYIHTLNLCYYLSIF